jgi:acyl-CoA synthetase (AMP-forming)/AMP-acid ligase II
VSTPSTLLGLLEHSPPEQTAVVLPEQHLRLGYGALRDQVQRVAEQLAAASVGRGDRVGIALPNGLALILSVLAASVAGTAAPLNPASTDDEFRFYLEDTGARIMILPPDGLEAARRAAGDRVRILTIDMDAAGVITLSGASGVIGRRSVVPPSVDDVALVLHTSGTTGRPKRVPLAHAQLSISAGNVARTYALTSNDVSLCVMPLFHVHGLVASTLATLATGGTVVVPHKFRPLSFWRVARDHRVTWYSAAPALHQLLLARAGDPSDPARRPAGTERLRFIRSCGASLAPRVMHALEAAFGAPVLEAYGMTEAAHVTSNPLPPAKRKPGSVGCGTDVRVDIVDRAGGSCPKGERGEVVVQGLNIVRGYENDPEANAASFVNGWFRTGDRGYLDADGYLWLIARAEE